jgi:phage tail sheath protein FI
MSTLTLASPGVQINEVDLSLLAKTSGQTNVFVTGFADKGPTDEIVNVGSISEYEDVFGTPTNAAERYLYQSARQVLTQSNGNLLVTRMPYGSGSGAGFSNTYSALVYGISANAANYSDATSYTILEPQSILLSEDQYTSLLSNDVTWSTGFNSASANITDASGIGRAGLVVVNPSKLSVNNLFEGYYIGIADNSNNNPATDFNAITGIKSANTVVNGSYQTFATVPQSRLNFSLTQAYSAAGTSISEVVEKFPTSYDFGSSSFNDCLTLTVFKIRSSIYAQDTIVLDYVTQEGYTGSLYSLRTQNNPSGGAPVTFNLDAVANQRSNNVKVITNPYIANTGNWIGSNGVPLKTVRVSNAAKNLYSEGVYISDTNDAAKDVGNVPQKLQRILNNVDVLDVSLDVTAEAGLGTIWASAKARWSDPVYGNSSTGQPYVYDESYTIDLTGLKNQSTGSSDSVALNYNSVASQFVAFAEQTRKDHVFLADPLKGIFVSGKDIKVSKGTGYVFSSDVYWTIKNLYASSISSYTAVYGNWLKINDTASNSQVWVPASGWAAAVFAQSAQTSFPWSAPAGFNRGALTNVLDLAINPTQKQRDLLYRININPIAFFPGDGYVIYGQKTLFTKPSAFDRINVRRLFLTLEKSTQSLLKYFVFEPNSFTTRTRLVNSLTPIFNQAKNNNGLYDYKIVCDERNNTPDVIDANQLKVSIYIQPVRTSEFILADFIATQTGVNFSELIG